MNTDETRAKIREGLAESLYKVCASCNSTGTKWEHLKNPEARAAWYSWADLLMGEVNGLLVIPVEGELPSG